MAGTYGTALSTLRSDVQFRLLRTDVSNNSIDRRINWSCKDIARRVKVPELETTVGLTCNTSTGIISLTTTQTILSVISVRDRINNSALMLASPTMYANFTTKVGTPTYYFHWGFKIYVHMHTTGATTARGFTVVYRKYPSTMSSDTDKPDLPDYLDEAIVSGACYQIFRDLGELEQAQAAFVQYASILNSVRSPSSMEFESASQGTAPVIK